MQTIRLNWNGTTPMAAAMLGFGEPAKKMDLAFIDRARASVTPDAIRQHRRTSRRLLHSMNQVRESATIVKNRSSLFVEDMRH